MRYDPTHPTISRYDEDEWNDLEDWEQNRLATVGGSFAQGEYSPELQELQAEIRGEETRRDLKTSLALQGGQLAAGGLMYLSPQDRANRQALERIDRQLATGQALSPQELEFMELQGRGQASTLATEERMRTEAAAASVGASGIETLRAAERAEQGAGRQAASEVGRTIARANLEAAQRLAREQQERIAYKSEALKQRVLEPAAQAVGDLGALAGTARAMAPGEDVAGAFDEMRNVMVQDPDNPDQMIRAFTGQEIAQTYRYVRQLPPERQREYLQELEDRHGVALGISRELEPKPRTEGEEPPEEAVEEAAREPLTEEGIFEAIAEEGTDTSLEHIVHEDEDPRETALDFRDWMNDEYGDIATELELDDSATIADEDYGDDELGIIIGTSATSSMRSAWEYDIEGQTAGTRFLATIMLEAQESDERERRAGMGQR